jgi:hypothetical protein
MTAVDVGLQKLVGNSLLPGIDHLPIGNSLPYLLYVPRLGGVTQNQTHNLNFLELISADLACPMAGIPICSRRPNGDAQSRPEVVYKVKGVYHATSASRGCGV